MEVMEVVEVEVVEVMEAVEVVEVVEVLEVVVLEVLGVSKDESPLEVEASIWCIRPLLAGGVPQLELHPRPALHAHLRGDGDHGDGDEGGNYDDDH